MGLGAHALWTILFDEAMMFLWGALLSQLIYVLDFLIAFSQC